MTRSEARKWLFQLSVAARQPQMTTMTTAVQSGRKGQKVTMKYFQYFALSLLCAVAAAAAATGDFYISSSKLNHHCNALNDLSKNIT